MKSVVAAAVILFSYAAAYTQTTNDFQQGVEKFQAELYAQAIADFSRALKSKPKHTEAFMLRGRSKIEMGDYDGAIDDFTKAIALNPKDANGYFWRAYAYAKSGDARPKPQATSTFVSSSSERLEPTPEARINAQQIAEYNRQQAYWADQQQRYLSGNPINALSQTLLQDRMDIGAATGYRDNIINGGSYRDEYGRQRTAPLRLMPEPQPPIPINQYEYTSRSYTATVEMPNHNSQPAAASPGATATPRSTTRRTIMPFFPETPIPQDTVTNRQRLLQTQSPTTTPPLTSGLTFQSIEPIRLNPLPPPADATQQVQTMPYRNTDDASTRRAEATPAAPPPASRLISGDSTSIQPPRTRSIPVSPSQDNEKSSVYTPEDEYAPLDFATQKDRIMMSPLQQIRYDTWQRDSVTKEIQKELADYDRRMAAKDKAAADALAAARDKGTSSPPVEATSDYRQAVADYTKAIEIDPDYGAAYYNRGLLKQTLGDKQSACRDWSKAGETGMADAYDLIKRNCR